MSAICHCKWRGGCLQQRERGGGEAKSVMLRKGKRQHVCGNKNNMTMITSNQQDQCTLCARGRWCFWQPKSHARFIIIASTHSSKVVINDDGSADRGRRCARLFHLRMGSCNCFHLLKLSLLLSPSPFLMITATSM